MTHYPGTYHGFAVRGSDKDPVVQKAKEQAHEEVIAWFNDTM